MKKLMKRIKTEKPTVRQDETHLTEKERRQMYDDILRTQIRIAESSHFIIRDKFCR